LRISEPVTTFTDYILAVELIVLGLILLKEGSDPRRLWGAGFLAAAIAAMAGGTYHGFIQSFTPGTSSALWKLTIYSVGVSALLMLSASILATTKGSLKTILLGATVVSFLFYVIVMIKQNDFRYVIYYYAPAMITILILQLIWRQASTNWTVSGIVLSFGAASVQQSGFRAGQHFNHNDVYHIMQMTAMYLLYRGGKLF
jgi:hypothetical protein